MTRMSIGRRDVLKRLGAAGAALAAAGGVAGLAWDRGGGVAQTKASPKVRDFRQGAALDEPSMAIARNDTDPAALAKKAVDALGGMKRFVSRGDIVVVKPNIGWDRTPLHAANTNPLVVAEIVRQAYDAGAKNVVVTDASCNEPARCFTRSGIWQAAYDAGAEVIMPAQHRFRPMRLQGEVLGEWPVYTALVEADKLINVPVAKHHNLAKYTGAMKNWYGSLGGRRNRLHQNIDTSIADLATFLRPTLTVLDATRILLRNGPQGGNIADTKELFTVVASIDQVAADAFGCELIGLTARDVPYMAMAEGRGLGTTDYASLSPVEV